MSVPLRRLLDTCASLLLKLLFADVVCACAGEWITSLMAPRRTVAVPISRRGAARTGDQNASRGLKVIICGLPRTGTASLTKAMEILGFPCLHGFDVLLNPRLCNLLIKAADSGRASDWDRTLQGYAAIADFPAACAYKRLIELYPDAKLILTVREAERWYRSMSQTLLVTWRARDVVSMIRRRTAMQRAVRGLFLRRLVLDDHCTQADQEGSINNNEWDYIIHQDTGSNYSSHLDNLSDDDCERVFLGAYRRHTQEVKAHVSPSKLLVFHVERNPGWGPLCEFLGVPVPDPEDGVPFPRTNDSRSFNQLQSSLVPIYATLLALYVAFLAFLVAFLFHRYRKQMA